MPSLRMASQNASTKTRVTGATTIQTVKATAGIVRKVIVANGDAAVQTVTLTDGATVQIVLRVPAGDTRVFDLGVPFSTSIGVTPSDADLDCLVLYD